MHSLVAAPHLHFPPLDSRQLPSRTAAPIHGRHKRACGSPIAPCEEHSSNDTCSCEVCEAWLKEQQAASSSTRGVPRHALPILFAVGSCSRRSSQWDRCKERHSLPAISEQGPTPSTVMSPGRQRWDRHFAVDAETIYRCGTASRHIGSTSYAVADNVVYSFLEPPLISGCRPPIIPPLVFRSASTQAVKDIVTLSRDHRSRPRQNGPQRSQHQSREGQRRGRPGKCYSEF